MSALHTLLGDQGRLISLPGERTVVFVGDTHGDLGATQHVLQRYPPHTHTLVFLGDYVDRGPDSLGNLQALLEAKLAHPDDVVLLMGNHEGWAATPFSPADFWQDLPTDESAAWAELLSQLPFAAHHPAGLMAVHGALPDVMGVGEIAAVELGSADWRKMTWGDWAEVPGFVVDPGIHGRPAFGRDYFNEVADRLSINVLVRAHQPHAATFMYENRCLTIFTSRAYPETRRQVALLQAGVALRDARDLELQPL